jgi:hypothetical protein
VRCPRTPSSPLDSTTEIANYASIPLSAVQLSGDRVVVTLDFGVALSNVAGGHGSGAVLREPAASTWTDFGLGLVYDDATAAGRAYTVGS